MILEALNPGRTIAVEEVVNVTMPSRTHMCVQYSSAARAPFALAAKGNGTPSIFHDAEALRRGSNATLIRTVQYLNTKARPGGAVNLLRQNHYCN